MESVFMPEKKPSLDELIEAANKGGDDPGAGSPPPAHTLDEMLPEEEPVLHVHIEHRKNLFRYSFKEIALRFSDPICIFPLRRVSSCHRYEGQGPRTRALIHQNTSERS